MKSVSTVLNVDRAMTPMLNKSTACATALGSCSHLSCGHPEVNHDNSRLNISELQSVSAHKWQFRARASLCVLLSIVTQGFVSLGTIWMWPAMNLFLCCGHLTARCDCTRDGELADARWTDSGLLAFYRKELVAGNTEGVTFEVHSVILVKGK